MNKAIYESNLKELIAVRAKLFDICKVYSKARPAIVLIKKILFFKPKLSAIIGLLIETLDQICNNDTT